MSKKRSLDSAMSKSVVEAKHDTEAKPLSIEKKVNKFDMADEVLGTKVVIEEPKATVSVVKPKTKTDSFCFPEDDYNLIDTIKQRFLSQGRVVNKSETLRIGLNILNEMSDKELLLAANKIQKVKLGRR